MVAPPLFKGANLMKLQGFLAVLGIPITFLFGEWSPFMNVLLVFIALDTLTGFFKALVNRQLRGRNMSLGILRKAGIFLVLIIGNMIDVVLFDSVPVAKSALIFFYIGMEGISIVENLHELGIPIPDFIGRYLETIKEKGEALEETEQADPKNE